jgi:hypothetical protein
MQPMCAADIDAICIALADHAVPSFPADINPSPEYPQAEYPHRQNSELTLEE